MLNLVLALHPSLQSDTNPRGFRLLRWLREQARYLDALRQLRSLEPPTLDDIGVLPDQFPELARRYARDLPPIERATAG